MDNTQGKSIISRHDPRIAGIPGDFNYGGLPKSEWVDANQWTKYDDIYQAYLQKNPGYKPPEPSQVPPKAEQPINNPPASYIKPNYESRNQESIRAEMERQKNESLVKDNQTIVDLLNTEEEKIEPFIWDSIFQIKSPDITLEKTNIAYGEEDPRYGEKMPEKSKGWWWPKKQKRPFNPEEYPKLYEEMPQLEILKNKTIERLRQHTTQIQSIHPKLKKLIRVSNKVLAEYLEAYEAEMLTIQTDSDLVRRDIEIAEQQLAREHERRNREKHDRKEATGFWAFVDKLLPEYTENIHYDDMYYPQKELEQTLKKTKTERMLKHEKRLQEIIDEFSITGVMDMLQSLEHSNRVTLQHSRDYEVKRKELYARLIDSIGRKVKNQRELQDHVIDSEKILLQNIADGMSMNEEYRLFQEALEHLWGKDPMPEGADAEQWRKERKEAAARAEYIIREEAAMGQEISEMDWMNRAKYYDKGKLLSLLFNPNYPASIANVYSRHIDEYIIEMEDKVEPGYVNRLVSKLKHMGGAVTELLPQLASLLPVGYAKDAYDHSIDLGYRMLHNKTFRAIASYAAPPLKKVLSGAYYIGKQTLIHYALFDTLQAFWPIATMYMFNILDQNALRLLNKIYELHPKYNPKYLNAAITFSGIPNSKRGKILKAGAAELMKVGKKATGAIWRAPSKFAALAPDYMAFYNQLQKDTPVTDFVSTRTYQQHKMGDLEILRKLSKGIEPNEIDENKLREYFQMPTRRTFRFDELGDMDSVRIAPAPPPVEEVPPSPSPSPINVPDLTDIPDIDVPPDDEAPIQSEHGILQGNLNDLGGGGGGIVAENPPPRTPPPPPSPVPTPPSPFTPHDFANALQHMLDDGSFSEILDQIQPDDIRSTDARNQLVNQLAETLHNNLSLVAGDENNMVSQEELTRLFGDMDDAFFEQLVEGNVVSPDTNVPSPKEIQKAAEEKEKEAEEERNKKQKKAELEQKLKNFKYLPVNDTQFSKLAEELTAHLVKRSVRITSPNKAWSDVFITKHIHDDLLPMYNNKNVKYDQQNIPRMNQIKDRALSLAKVELRQFLELNGGIIPTAEMMTENAKILKDKAEKSLKKQLLLEGEYAKESSKRDNEKKTQEISKRIEEIVNDKMKYLYQLSFIKNLKDTFKNNHYEIQKDAERSTRFLREMVWYYERAQDRMIEDYGTFHEEEMEPLGNNPGFAQFQFLGLLKDIHQKDMDHRRKTGTHMSIPFSRISQYLENYRNQEATDYVNKEGEVVNLFSMIPASSKFGNYFDFRGSYSDSLIGSVFAHASAFAMYAVEGFLPGYKRGDSKKWYLAAVPFTMLGGMIAWGIHSHVFEIPGVQSILLTHLLSDGLLVPIVEKVFGTSYMELLKSQHKTQKTKFKLDDRYLQRSKLLERQFYEKRQREASAVADKLTRTKQNRNYSQRVYQETTRRLRSAGGPGQIAKLQQADYRFIQEQVQLEEKEKDLARELEMIRQRKFGDESTGEFLQEYDVESKNLMKQLGNMDMKLKIIKFVRNIPTAVNIGALAWGFIKANYKPRELGTYYDATGREVPKFQKSVFQLDNAEAAMDDYLGIDPRAVADPQARIDEMMELIKKPLDTLPQVPPSALTFEATSEALLDVQQNLAHDIIDREMVLVDIHTGEIIEQPTKTIQLHLSLLEGDLDPETCALVDLSKPFRLFPDTPYTRQQFDPGYTPGKISLFDEEISNRAGVIWNSGLDDITVRLVPKAFLENIEQFSEQLDPSLPKSEMFSRYFKGYRDQPYEEVSNAIMSRLDKMQMQFMISNPVGGLDQVNPIKPKDTGLFNLLGGEKSGPTSENLVNNPGTMKKFSSDYYHKSLNQNKTPIEMLTDIVSSTGNDPLPNAPWITSKMIEEGEPWTREELDNMTVSEFTTFSELLRDRYSVEYTNTYEGRRIMYQFLSSNRDHHNLIAYLRRQQALRNADYFTYGMAWLHFAKGWLLGGAEYNGKSIFSGAKLLWRAFINDLGYGEGIEGMNDQLDALLKVRDKLRELLETTNVGEKLVKVSSKKAKPVTISGLEDVPTKYTLQTNKPGTLTETDVQYMDLWKDVNAILHEVDPTTVIPSSKQYEEMALNFEKKKAYTEKLYTQTKSKHEALRAENILQEQIKASKQISAIAHELTVKIFSQGFWFYLENHAEVTSMVPWAARNIMGRITGVNPENAVGASPIFTLFSSLFYWTVEEAIWKISKTGTDISERAAVAGKHPHDLLVKEIMEPDGTTPLMDVVASPYYDFEHIERPRAVDPFFYMVFKGFDLFHDASVGLAELDPEASSVVYYTATGVNAAASMAHEKAKDWGLVQKAKVINQAEKTMHIARSFLTTTSNVINGTQTLVNDLHVISSYVEGLKNVTQQPVSETAMDMATYVGENALDTVGDVIPYIGDNIIRYTGLLQMDNTIRNLLGVKPVKIDPNLGTWESSSQQMNLGKFVFDFFRSTPKPTPPPEMLQLTAGDESATPTPSLQGPRPPEKTPTPSPLGPYYGPKVPPYHYWEPSTPTPEPTPSTSPSQNAIQRIQDATTVATMKQAITASSTPKPIGSIAPIPPELLETRTPIPTPTPTPATPTPTLGPIETPPPLMKTKEMQPQTPSLQHPGSRPPSITPTPTPTGYSPVVSKLTYDLMTKNYGAGPPPTSEESKTTEEDYEEYWETYYKEPTWWESAGEKVGFLSEDRRKYTVGYSAAKRKKKI